MQRKKVSEQVLKKRLRGDPEAVQADADFLALNKATLEFGEFEMDPVMIEAARSKQLRQVTIRIGEEQFAEAQRVAHETGEKYQKVIRRWLAREASLSRRQRLQRSPLSNVK